jgi:hypothetical protein
MLVDLDRLEREYYAHQPDPALRGVRSIELDGQGLPNHTVPLSNDGKTHSVRVQLGEPSD